MGLFEKKYCDICGEKIGLLGNRKLSDGNLCKECASKLSPFFSDRKASTVDEIRAQLEYREANKEAVAAFNITRTYGTGTKIHLDQDNKKFMVTSATNLANANPDVLDYSQVTGCRIDIDEDRYEMKGKTANGAEAEYSPAQYGYEYDFYVVINVNSPYFNEIKFKLNNSEIVNEPSIQIKQAGAAPGIGSRPAANPALASAKIMAQARANATAPRPAASVPAPTPRPGTTPQNGQQPKPVIQVLSSTLPDINSNSEYVRFREMGEEIKNALMGVHEEAREASKPILPVTCPSCGATTTPVGGCCEFCGCAINS